MKHPTYIRQFGSDVKDVLVFSDDIVAGGIYRTFVSWRGFVAIWRLFLRQLLPGIAPILLSRIPLTSLTNPTNDDDDVLSHPATRAYFAAGIAMFAAPLIERALFNGRWLDWQTPPGLSAMARDHIRQALQLIIGMGESLAGVVTSAVAAGFILGKEVGPGPMLAAGIGAVTAILLGIILNVTLNSQLHRLGIPHSNNHDVDEGTLDDVSEAWPVTLQFGCSGMIGLIGVSVGAVLAFIEFRSRSSAEKSAWLVITYIPAVGDLFVLATALLQFNLQMQQAVSVFIRVKADAFRRYSL